MTTTKEGIARAVAAFKSVLDLMCKDCGWRDCRCEEFAARREGRVDDELSAILRSFAKRKGEVTKDEIRGSVRRWAERHGRPMPPVHFCRAKHSVFVGPKDAAGDSLCGRCGDCYRIEGTMPGTLKFVIDGAEHRTAASEARFAPGELALHVTPEQFAEIHRLCDAITAGEHDAEEKLVAHMMSVHGCEPFGRYQIVVDKPGAPCPPTP